MCKCGCGTCETKITGPLLTESKVKSLLSEGLNHHISNAIPLHETVYRYGSEKHLALIKEARKLYSRHVIDLNEHDIELVNTHLGEWGLFEGESVPLDLPMMNEEYSTLDLYQIADKLKDQGFSVKIKPSRFDKGMYDVTHFAGDIDDLQLALNDIFGRDNYRISFDEAYSGFMRSTPDPDSESFEPAGSVAQFREELEALFSKFKGDLKNPDFIRGVAQIMVNWKSLLRSQLDEKKKSQKKDPPIGKPKRGGSKAYYVYVRDPKTKRIKKVSFGSGGLRAKINNPKARQAFAARHRCKEKNDRTKPGYWSCRLPRYAKALGLGNNKNTFW